MSDSALPSLHLPNTPSAGKQSSKASNNANKDANSEEEMLEERQGILAGLLNRSASWMTSFVVHMAIIIALALYILPSVQVPDTLIAGIQGEKMDEELLDVPEIDLDEIELDLEPEEVDLQPETEVVEEEISFSPSEDLEAAAANIEITDLGIDAVPVSVSTSSEGFDGSALSGRGHASRAANVSKYGGSPQSEEAVALALKWLAKHQSKDGSWLLDHRKGGDCNGQCRNPGAIVDSARGGTALALLPYLGAGQTRFKGDYKNTVGRGLNALVRMGKKPKRGKGVSWADGGNMYAHGIASIALCEAYGMTNDSQLQAPAQASLDYIVSAQNPSDGGWRYQFQQAGDTSVVGWQVMALKSGHLAGLHVPPHSVAGASKFLDLAQNDEYGGAYAYTTVAKKSYRASTSSIGLLCRMYLGWKKEHHGIIDGVERLVEKGPSKADYYYNYYASQVVFQYTNGTGPMWREWNEKLRDHLITTQVKKGHERGSWFVKGPHGSGPGGRLYMTAIACMNLEVYYRHMPIYQVGAVENEFPE